MPVRRSCCKRRVLAEACVDRRPRRTAHRSAVATSSGCTPGVPGRRVTVLGSKGGKNGARSARRAERRGTQPAPATQSLHCQDAPAVEPSHLDLLEVFADPASQLAKVWAARGFSSVRVSELKSCAPAKPGPIPVAGTALTWYLDLSRSDDRKLLCAYATVWRPRDLWTASPCTAFSRIQFLNRAQFHEAWRPPSEDASVAMLMFCRHQHCEQKTRGGRSHHEQSARSSAPFDDPRQTWPWAISDPPKSQVVSGCQVGLRERWGSGLLLAKEWRVESTSEELLIVLAPYICQGGHEHGNCLGKRRLQLTGRYTPMFAQLVLQALRPETS